MQIWTRLRPSRHASARIGPRTDVSGEYAALYRPYHLIGLELGISVASAALRGEPTGASRAFVADVGATAKKDLKPGDVLDGEGGTTVYGRLVRAQETDLLRGGAGSTKPSKPEGR